MHVGGTGEPALSSGGVAAAVSQAGGGGAGRTVWENERQVWISHSSSVFFLLSAVTWPRFIFHIFLILSSFFLCFPAIFSYCSLFDGFSYSFFFLSCLKLDFFFFTFLTHMLLCLCVSDWTMPRLSHVRSGCPSRCPALTPTSSLLTGATVLHLCSRALIQVSFTSLPACAVLFQSAWTWIIMTITYMFSRALLSSIRSCELIKIFFSVLLMWRERSRESAEATAVYSWHSVLMMFSLFLQRLFYPTETPHARNANVSLAHTPHIHTHYILLFIHFIF